MTVTRNCCASSLATLLLLAIPSDVVQAGDAGAFRDTFDSLAEDRWFVSDGWVNGAHQNCLWSRSHVRVAGGQLLLDLSDKAAEGHVYGCGEVQSKARFGYGVFEARLKVPAGSGINANFFTHVGAPQKEPHNEIDFEFLGRSPDRVQLNFFAAGEGGHETMAAVPGASAGFHDYAIVWEPDRLRWFRDGRLLHEVRGGVPDRPQKVYLSLWASDTMGDWLGPFAYPGRPLTLAVDWVAFTPAGAPCGFPESILCSEALGPRS